MQHDLLHKLMIVSYSCLLLIGCTAIQPPSTTTEQKAKSLIDISIDRLEKGDLLGAEAGFRVAAEAAQLPAAYDGLGCVAFLQGDHKKAISLLQSTIDWFPEYVPAYGNLAVILDLVGRKKESQELFEIAIAKDPTNFKIRNNFAIHLREDNKEKLAQTFLRDAFSLSEHPIVGYNLTKGTER